MRLVRQDGRRLVYVDESVFTYKTNLRKTYAGARKHVKITNRELSAKTIRLYAAISLENGFEGAIV